MKKYNILFLDFDGVFNGIGLRDWKNNRYSLDKDLGGVMSKIIPGYKTKWQHFDVDIFYSKVKILIEALRDIPDLKIVLSTSWRNLKTPHEFDTAFKAIPGWTFDIIGKTGHDEHSIRGKEIKSWLELNCNLVKHYVILDDETIDMLPEQADHIVKTSVVLGITHKDAIKIKKKMNNKGVCNERLKERSTICIRDKRRTK